MKRAWAKALSFGILSVAVAALSPACADNSESLYIQGVVIPPAVTNGPCVYQADAQAGLLLSGKLDIAARSDYSAPIIVRNQLQSRVNRDTNRTEPNRFVVEGTITRVTFPSGEVVDEFSSFASRVIDPDPGQQPGSGVVSALLVSPNTIAQIKAKRGEFNDRRKEVAVIANVKVFGRTLGGVEVESAEFPFPITVCRGCAINFSCASATLGCGGAIDSTTQGCAPVCNVGQDQPYPCQLCITGDPACAFPPKDTF
jgi:hypothetical protein